MKKYYKLTTQDMTTHVRCKWILGKWKKARGNSRKGLCSNAWLHCYDSPLLAVLLNPIHANIKNPRLFEVEVKGMSKNDRGTKRGFKQMKLIKELDVPNITTEQRIKFVILCAIEVYESKSFNVWAKNWLSGADKSYSTANNAYNNVVWTYRINTICASSAAYCASSAAYYASLCATDYNYNFYNATAANAVYHAADYNINLVILAKKAMED